MIIPFPRREMPTLDCQTREKVDRLMEKSSASVATVMELGTRVKQERPRLREIFHKIVEVLPGEPRLASTYSLDLLCTEIVSKCLEKCFSTKT